MTPNLLDQRKRSEIEVAQLMKDTHQGAPRPTEAGDALETELDFEQLASHASEWPLAVRDVLGRYVARAMTNAGIDNKRQRLAVQAELAHLFGEI